MNTTCIVLDEAHNTSAASYQKIIDYFKPRFWLGMTATPERTDDFGSLYSYLIIILFMRSDYSRHWKKTFSAHSITFGSYNDLDSEGDADVDSAEKQGRDFQVFNRLPAMSGQIMSSNKLITTVIPGDRVKGLIFCSSVLEAQELSETFNKRGGGFRTLLSVRILRKTGRKRLTA